MKLFYMIYENSKHPVLHFRMSGLGLPWHTFMSCLKIRLQRLLLNRIDISNWFKSKLPQCPQSITVRRPLGCLLHGQHQNDRCLRDKEVWQRLNALGSKSKVEFLCLRFSACMCAYGRLCMCVCKWVLVIEQKYNLKELDLSFHHIYVRNQLRLTGLVVSSFTH